MTVEAHAKINWTLEVLGVRSDGYHDLRSVVLPIPLHDTVSLEASETISCVMTGMSDVPPEANLAFRAAVALREAIGCRRGVRIAIEKRIPAGAGLGGGSADAAAVLNGLNALWELHLPKQELCEIADMLERALANGAVCVVGGKDKLAACDGCLDTVFDM